MHGMIIDIVIAFILRQLGKFGETIDWDKVLLDADVRIRAILPGEFLDDEGAGLVRHVILALKDVLLNQGGLKQALELIAEGKQTAALDALSTELFKFLPLEGDRE